MGLERSGGMYGHGKGYQEVEGMVLRLGEVNFRCRA